MRKAYRQQKLIISPCKDDPTPDNMWEKMKSAILKTSTDILDHTKKKNRDWFDENDKEIQDLLTEKRAAHQGHHAQPTCPAKKDTYWRACSNLQRKLSEIKNKWWNPGMC